SPARASLGSLLGGLSDRSRNETAQGLPPTRLAALKLVSLPRLSTPKRMPGPATGPLASPLLPVPLDERGVHLPLDERGVVEDLPVQRDGGADALDDELAQGAAHA